MNRFPKKRRLNTKHDFDLVFDQAKKVVLLNFIFFFRMNAVNKSRLGMVIPKRKISKAHDRNRVKRLIREAFRSENLPAFDIVVLARKEIGRLNNQSLRQEMEQAWKKIEQS